MMFGDDNTFLIKKQKSRYFGTDGFRGEANKDLTGVHAYKIGRFLGWYFSSKISSREKGNGRPRIVIGKDTRRSSYMIEYSVAAGITASGSDAYILHVTTTPSVSYVIRQDGFDAGVMITASHNPYFDNGIKLINRYGEKMEDSVIELLESYLDGNVTNLEILNGDLPLPTGDKIGSVIDYFSGRNRYVGYLISIASHSYRHLKIGLDCANGASWQIARSVFSALGAELLVLGDQPNGLNVNKDCGSTNIEKLKNLVKSKHLDVGFAFDGDADRCLAIDSNGNVVDGDAILYILAKRLKKRGILKENTLVCTIMSNSGLISALEKEKIKCVQTDVGDRNVYEKMQELDSDLGGEQSGHIIVKKYATTGDGILTALLVLEEMCDTKSTLSGLVGELKLFPQVLKNLRVLDKEKVLKDLDVIKAVQIVNEKLNGNGRVLLRKSGTEPKIRIMVEAKTNKLCNAFIDEIANVILKKGLGFNG